MQQFLNKKGICLQNGDHIVEGQTRIPAWMINNIHCMEWDEITYPLPNSRLCRCELGIGMEKQFHPLFYNGCNYLTMLESKAGLSVLNDILHIPGTLLITTMEAGDQEDA